MLGVIQKLSDLFSKPESFRKQLREKELEYVYQKRKELDEDSPVTISDQAEVTIKEIEVDYGSKTKHYEGVIEETEHEVRVKEPIRPEEHLVEEAENYHKFKCSFPNIRFTYELVFKTRFKHRIRKDNYNDLTLKNSYTEIHPVELEILVDWKRRQSLSFEEKVDKFIEEDGDLEEYLENRFDECFEKVAELVRITDRISAPYIKKENRKSGDESCRR